MSEENLRALIRYLAPMTTLRQDLERVTALEFQASLGDTAVRTYNGLHASILRIMDDPYLESLSLQVPPGANDKEKVALVFLSVGQLLALLHSAIGLPVGWGSPSIEIQTAPYVIINASNSSPAVADHAMSVVHKVLGEDDGDAE